MAHLGRVEADRGDAVEVGLGFLQRLERVVFVEMAQEAEDQLRGDAAAPRASFSAREHAVGDDGERKAARGVRLRIEEHFDVARMSAATRFR